jgi:hypothetical protein
LHPKLPIFDTNGIDFDTMSKDEKVRHLKIDRGRYFYQRRVPQTMQAHLGIRRWQLPCGDVSYSKAVQMVVTWAEEHDELVADLRNPDRLREAGVAAVRKANAKRATEPHPLGLPSFYEMTERLDGEKQYFPRESLPRPWQAAAKMLAVAEADYAGKPSLDAAIWEINYRIEELQRGDDIVGKKSLPGLPGLKEYVETLDPKLVAAAKIEVRDTPLMPLYPDLFLDRLNAAYDVGFGPDRAAPSDSDQKDEYDFIKRKLERKISELSPDANTVCSVAERYCDFNSIRLSTRSKYRRELARLVAITGDVPIGVKRTAIMDHRNGCDIAQL